MESNLIDMDDIGQKHNIGSNNDCSLIDSNVVIEPQISTNYQSIASEQNSIVINQNQIRTNSMNTNQISYYDYFREYMKKPESQNIKNELLRFLNDSEKGLKKKQKNENNKKMFSQQINLFIENFESSFQNLYNFGYEREYDNGEAIEGIVVKALYNQLVEFYSPEIEEKLDMNLYIFQFLRLENLECSESMVIERHFEDAKQQLQKINDYKTPRDKLVAIINTCKIISNMVYNSKTGQKSPTGADEFLPILIYLIIKANPKKSNSNIQFIDDFRASKRLKGLEEYYFTSFKSAIEFIEGLDSSKLKIQQNEYDQIYQEQLKNYQEHMIKERERISKSNNINQLQKQLNYEQTKNDKYKDKLHNLGQKIKQVKSNIQTQSQLKTVNHITTDLKMNQIPDLLSELKILQNTVSELTNHMEQIEKIMNEDQQVQTRKLFGFGIF